MDIEIRRAEAFDAVVITVVLGGILFTADLVRKRKFDLKMDTISCPQFYAYEMDNDDMPVGYGLPWQDKLRNVPYISKLVR